MASTSSLFVFVLPIFITLRGKSIETIGLQCKCAYIYANKPDDFCMLQTEVSFPKLPSKIVVITAFTVLHSFAPTQQRRCMCFAYFLLGFCGSIFQINVCACSTSTATSTPIALGIKLEFTTIFFYFAPYSRTLARRTFVVCAAHTLLRSRSDIYSFLKQFPCSNISIVDTIRWIFIHFCKSKWQNVQDSN